MILVLRLIADRCRRGLHRLSIVMQETPIPHASYQQKDGSRSQALQPEPPGLASLTRNQRMV
jgi:hypothetical protein